MLGNTIRSIGSIFRKVQYSAGVGRKALAMILAIALITAVLPTAEISASAEMVSGNAGFSVIAYDRSARIQIPAVSGAVRYKVYLAQTGELTDFSGQSCVFSSDTYQPYAYAVDGDKDAADASKTISIGYVDNGENTYYFYLVTNDGSTDTLQSVFTAQTRATETCYWTSPGCYDSGWYVGHESDTEYRIGTAAQLAGLAVLNNGLNGVSPVSFSGKTIKLTASIDLSANLWTPIGAPTKPFGGVFDGGNYDGVTFTGNNIVSGLHTNDSTKDYQGLFGHTNLYIKIKNFGVVGGCVKGRKYIGGVAGDACYSTVTGCYNTGTVSGTGGYIGGIVGNGFVSTFTGCYNTGIVSGKGIYVGGIVAYASTPTNCYNTGTVSGTSYVGGVMGKGSRATNSYNSGTVSGTSGIIGGVVGQSSIITDCYNTGTVSGIGGTVSVTGSIGGVAGKSGIITGCYNTGEIIGTGNQIGGVAGYAADGDTLISCYNTGAVSGAVHVGGILGADWSYPTPVEITGCYNTGAVSGSDWVSGITAHVNIIKTCYNIGMVNGNYPLYYYNASNTLDTSATTASELIAKVDVSSTSPFCAAPNGYALDSVFSISNPVNYSCPVLRYFGYTDTPGASGFSPATVTVDASTGAATIGTDYGDGTESKPFIIRNAYQMDLLRNASYSGKYFKLAGNIDLSPAQYKIFGIGGNWQPINTALSFDGNGFTVSGITINSDSSYQGLFGQVGSGSTIQNLGVTGCNIKGGESIGGVVGESKGKVINCYNIGAVSGVYQVGGVAGYIGGWQNGAVFTGCYNAGKVNCSKSSTYGLNSVGGVIGMAYCIAVTNCYNAGTASNIGEETGGIAGHSNDTIEKCYNTGTVTGSPSVGGIAGYGYTVTDCYSTGVTSGSSYVGGVAGFGYLTSCYNTGSVRGSTYVGGVVGVSDIVIGCFNSGTIRGTGNEIGGVVGCGNPLSCYNTGLVSSTGSNIGGVVGSTGRTAASCYNTGAISGNESVGGVVGKANPADFLPVEIKSCYSVGTVSGTSCVGGIVGNAVANEFSEGKIGVEITNCYSAGAVSGTDGNIGGVAGHNSGATLSHNYYCGYIGGVGQDGTPAAVDLAGGAAPFVSCENLLGEGDMGAITEVSPENLDPDFKAAFGITAIQYPNFYESSDAGVLTVSGKNLTGAAEGTAAVIGNTGTGVVITQNALNMTDDEAGFSGAGTTAVFGTVSLPVQVSKTASKHFSAFSVADGNGKTGIGKICDSNHTIAITVPYGTDVTNLTATFEAAGESVSVGSSTQESGVTANDFTNPVTYTVTAQDNSTQTYIVTVTKAKSSDKQIASFSIDSAAGKIDEANHTITVTVPYGTDLTNLIATFSVIGESVSVGSSTQESGTTGNDFTKPVDYTVTAADGSDQKYTVIVLIEPVITGFEGLSDAVKNRTVPRGTPEAALNLPDSLLATANGLYKIAVGISEWVCSVIYNPQTPGTYEFSPVLDSGYQIKDSGVHLPHIRVTVQGASSGGSSAQNSAPSLPSSVTGSLTQITANLSGATFPASVTGVSLSAAQMAANGLPIMPGTAGDVPDPQATAAYQLAVTNTGLNIIGTPILYSMKLLDQNGNAASFNGSVQVRLPLPAGLRGAPHVFRYEADNTFTDMNALAENGFLVFSTSYFSYYAIAGVGDSVMIDTTSYQMTVNGNYQIGMKLTGSKAAAVHFRSTNNRTATVAMLKNGNYQVTGRGTGTVYIMFDVYDNKSRLLTHASVRVDVQTGIRPGGDSARQYGVFS